MTDPLEGLLVLIAMPLGFLLNGCWLAAHLESRTPLERICVASLCGFAVVLLGLGALGFFHAIAGPWIAVCFAGILPTVLVPRTREALGRDLLAILRACPVAVWIAGVAFFAALLWPVLRTPAIVYFDGSANHDGFLWIARAGYLMRHAYMDAPVFSATQPVDITGMAIHGWAPVNGRMGAEGLLALAATMSGKAPVSVYLYVSAGLAFVWFAAVFLALRTFVTEKTSVATGVAIVALQPVFVFFHANANLPNLVGVLAGTAMVVAVARALETAATSRTEFASWAALAGLSLHGTLCSYPEMAPFVVLPCGLLLVRAAIRKIPDASRRVSLVAAALAAGAAINPATTVRALHGFIASFELARADATWFNLFSRLDPAEYIPAIVTLGFVGAKELGWLVGGAVSVLVVIVLALVFRFSRDRFGLLAVLSGFLVLVGYTVASGFSYGLQKAVQFSGVFVATMFPVAAVATLVSVRQVSAQRRALARAALVAVVAFTVFSSVMSYREIYKWSHRKVLSADWFDLLDESRALPAGAPVFVDAATFRLDFFHGMWATHFLAKQQLYFGARNGRGGGYLAADTANETDTAIPPASAVLVGLGWADSLDANSPRILAGREFALLESSNRVLRMEGVSPLNGVPDHAGPRITIEIVPHSPSTLAFELSPPGAAWSGAVWRVGRTAGAQPEFATALEGPPPWLFEIPLAAGERNVVSVEISGGGPEAGTPPFVLSRLRIEDAR